MQAQADTRFFASACPRAGAGAGAGAGQQLTGARVTALHPETKKQGCALVVSESVAEDSEDSESRLFQLRFK